MSDTLEESLEEMKGAVNSACQLIDNLRARSTEVEVRFRESLERIAELEEQDRLHTKACDKYRKIINDLEAQRDECTVEYVKQLADENRRLEAERDRLRKALHPFREASEVMGYATEPIDDDEEITGTGWPLGLTVAHLRHAAKVHKETGQ